MSRPFPVLFVSHGSPGIMLSDNGYGRALRHFTGGCTAPRAVVVVSAHWQTPGPARVTSGDRPRTLHDFSGFPPALDSISYGCPGDPCLAGEVAGILIGAGIPATLDPARGLDHGAWVPLRLAFPRGDVPVVQVSMSPSPSASAAGSMGRALGLLRDRGVLLMGSGGIVHNLHLLRPDGDRGPVDSWALEFDAWVRDQVGRLDTEALTNYRRLAPHAGLAAPTSEHLEPLHFVLGAARPGDRVVDVYEGFIHGNLSLRTFALGQ